MNQTQLFILKPSIEHRFREFHSKNPHVYQRLVELARELRAKGYKRAGIGMLYEVLRWQTMIKTVGEDYKLNDNYRSRYARLIMEKEPDLEGFFEKRRLHS